MQMVVKIAGRFPGTGQIPVVLATDASGVLPDHDPRHTFIATGYVATSGHYGAHALPSPAAVTGRNDVWVGELRAISRGLQAILADYADVPVVVLCDSLVACRTANCWLSGDVGPGSYPPGYTTRRSDWNPVGSLEWLAETFAAVPERFDVQWVRGHDGDPMNEGANDLARLAARTARGEVTQENAEIAAENWVPAILAGA